MTPKPETRHDSHEHGAYSGTERWNWVMCNRTGTPLPGIHFMFSLVKSLLGVTGTVACSE